MHKTWFPFLDQVQEGYDISVAIFVSSFLLGCFLNATKLSRLEIFQMNLNDFCIENSISAVYLVYIYFLLFFETL